MREVRQHNSGYALVTSLIVTAILTVLVLGFISQVNTEQKIARNDTDHLSAFYAAEAGLEKMNSDLSKLFVTTVFPTSTQVSNVAGTNNRPAIAGASYSSYLLTGGQSTRLSIALTAAATSASVISTAGWPSPGFFMVDSEEITYTGTTATTFTGLGRGTKGSASATHVINAGVSRSSVLTIAEGTNAGLMAQTIPFSMDVTARAGLGAEARLTREVQVALIPVFQFGVFSDSDLSFFAGPDFNFGGRVHSNGNIFLAQGDGGILTLSQKVTTAGEVIRQQLSNGVATNVAHKGVVRIVTTPGNFRNLALTEGSVIGGLGSSSWTGWPNLSITSYNKNLVSKMTGGKVLTLPFAGTATPIEIIKRGLDGDDLLLSDSRLYNQASLRVLMSDAKASLPGAVGYPLNSTLTAAPTNYTVVDAGGVFRPPFATANPNDPDFVTSADADETTAANLIDGFVLVQRQNTDGTWTDVTLEILNLGIATNQTNAILRFQAPRWDAADVTNSLIATDYAPINMYDAREGRFRDDYSSVGTNLRKLGIMNLVELDVNNLRRWFLGSIGATGTLALNNGGYIFYLSDRRGNRNAVGSETGDFGFEDFINPASQVGDPNGILDPGEDLNVNNTLETYGANLPYAPYATGTDLYNTSIPPPVAATAVDIDGSINNATTSIVIGSTALITTPGRYRIDQEIVNCTSQLGKTLTCVRAQDGTLAAVHSSTSIDLMADLNATAVNVIVHSTAGVTLPGFFRIDSETLYCASAAGNILTCERGRLGTMAVAHAAIINYVVENLTASDISINVGSALNVTIPGYYRIQNEVVNCSSKSGSTVTCSRGAKGTVAAAHPYVSNTISSSVSAATMSMPFSNNTNAATITPLPGLYRIDDEIVNCTLRSGSTVTCTRGQQGTTATMHNSGSTLRTQMEIRAVNVLAINLFTSERASKNRVHYFRRALRLVNGTSPNLPVPGFTVASENPVYVLGNYNSNGSTNFTDTHSFAAVIADAVTFLSNAWINGGDALSFIAPYTPSAGTTTWYRTAIAAGKGINFAKPINATPVDFGTDGGTHNFLRYLENWGANTSNYRGSIVSLYYYQQAVGPYKCCNSVYTAPVRAYVFDTDFLVPSQLPPGTPRFRDINNLSFRQKILAN